MGEEVPLGSIPVQDAVQDIDLGKGGRALPEAGCIGAEGLGYAVGVGWIPELLDQTDAPFLFYPTGEQICNRVGQISSFRIIPKALVVVRSEVVFGSKLAFVID